MTPTELIQWAVAITIALFILSATGIPDALGKLLTQRPTRGDLQRSVADLERRIVALEQAAARTAIQRPT